MKNRFSLFIATLCLVAIPLQSYAAKANKAKGAAQSTKEKLVLMPLRVPEEDKSLQGAMETALVEGLQQKYELLSGEQVAQKAREIFMKESRNTSKKECDETRCMQGIAEYFQSELIATAYVTKREDGYFLALSIKNIFDNLEVYSKSLPCKSCDAYQVVDKLKELSGASASAAPAEPEAPKVTATDPDSITWAEAQKGNTADDYQVYLDAYPKGKYVAFAKARIKKLKEAEQAANEQQEQSAWDTAQQENSEVSYDRYLKGYPAGRFAGFAKTRMDKLKKPQQAAAGVNLNLIQEKESLIQAIVRNRPNEETASGGECVFPDSDKRAPLWVCDSPVEGMAVGAVGSAQKSAAGFDFMKQMGATAARVQLAQNLKVQVVNMIKQHAETTGAARSEMVDQVSVSVIKQINFETLKGTKIFRTAEGPDGTLYVLVGLDEAQAAKLTETFVRASMDSDPVLWQQFRSR